MAHLRWLHFQKVLEVVDVTDLRWDSHSFPIDSPDLSIIQQSLIRTFAYLIKDKLAADHDTSPTLARLAVNSNSVLWTLLQKVTDIQTEVVHVDERRRLMIIKLERVAHLVEF